MDFFYLIPVGIGIVAIVLAFWLFRIYRRDKSIIGKVNKILNSEAPVDQQLQEIAVTLDSNSCAGGPKC